MRTALLDSETVGLYGPAAIFQVRFTGSPNPQDDQELIFCPWTQPVWRTKQLIEEIVDCRVVAHNLTFDWEKVSQFYNAIHALQDTDLPIDHIDQVAQAFYDNRSLFCLRPRAAVCTLLLAQKNLGGSALSTKEVRVRRVPRPVAQLVAHTLNAYTNLPNILFARRQEGDLWRVADSDAGPEWADLALRFAPSNGLKEIAKFVLGVEDTTKIGAEVLPPEFPAEEGYAPYAVLLDDGDWTYKGKPLWPRLVRDHVNFWTTNATAIKYAMQDIVLLDQLCTYLGSPESDFDSELACQVASVRVAGLDIDTAKVAQERARSQRVVDSAKINVDSPKQVREFITEALDPIEAMIIADSCDKAHLKSLIKEMNLESPEPCCRTGCARCDGAGELPAGPMPVVGRAQHILEVRKHRKRVQLYNKLAVSRSAFPAFRVIGAKSGRMSGTGGLNYHGIDGSREIREIFTFADKPGWIVSGADANSQELAITAAVMKDTALGEVLEGGKKLHAIFAAEANGIPYDQIMKYADDKTRPESKMYAQGKVTTYSILYGASSFKVSKDLGCTPEEADAKINAFFAKFPGMGETRKQVKQSLQCLAQDEDGRLVSIKPKQTYVESVFGFRRSFDTEFAVMQTMLQTMDDMRMSKIPDVYRESFERKVVRSEKKGEQTTVAAVKSALYGAIFSLQGSVFRAACNHLIQSSGRTCTLRVQHRIWTDLQPIGIHPFKVKLLSVHDEVITTCHRDDALKVQDAVQAETLELNKTVPLLSMNWGIDVGSWYGAKTAEQTTRVGWGSSE